MPGASCITRQVIDYFFHFSFDYSTQNQQEVHISLQVTNPFAEKVADIWLQIKTKEKNFWT
jgi:hypothetical protein